ncbi:cell death abnormality protein 1-like [Ostrea edulis]|uniref:cell death abnormality protein 1-like n=1 Tax=Ostrea edulis TaxID=37623 RepID=UPI0024AF4430|nr:cell death abnormality protein 1-like [Ostrea edulis]
MSDPCAPILFELNMILIFLLSCVFLSKVISYDNIALEKPAQQLYPYRYQLWGADLAVDGQKSDLSASGGQCTISDDRKQTAKWWVDLGGVLSIYYITIYYRTDNIAWDSSNPYTTRFLGFSVYISNTTNKDDGVQCFKDTEYNRDTIPNSTNITCPRHGRYVVYYNERVDSPPAEYSQYAHNELCEVEVYGCPTSGVYGENCDIPCPQNCQERHCDIVTGTCLGCIPGYKGSFCDQQCDGRLYGESCTQPCGQCQNLEHCHHINGTCLNGCGRGYHGGKCTEECPEGRYGYNCQERCNINCGLPERCDRVTGQCQNECQAGWKNQKCDSKCDGKTFGLGCTQVCGVCLGYQQCHHVNGTCTKGCDRGYEGINCTQECENGLYGYKCSKLCGHCLLPEQCDNINGICMGGCKSGFQGMFCTEVDATNRTSLEQLKEEHLKLDNVRLRYEIEKLKTENEIMAIQKEVLLLTKSKLECEIQANLHLDCQGKQ